MATRALIAALVVFGGAPPDTAPGQSSIPGVQTDEMAQAIATARRRLPVFWERVRANEPTETGYAVKVIASDQNGVEHLWLTRITLRNGRIYGMIDTAPRIVRSLRAGQILDVRQDSIVDWLYFENGRMVGNETGRVMLRYLAPAEREQMLKLYK
jgi:uncharacterized protein YegJ (DUF2314 family)